MSMEPPGWSSGVQELASTSECCRNRSCLEYLRQENIELDLCRVKSGGVDKNATQSLRGRGVIYRSKEN